MKPYLKSFLAVLLVASCSGLLAAPPINPRLVSGVEPPTRERQVTILRKQVLEKLIVDAERLDKIELADLKEIKEKRQELADGRYILFFQLHDLEYRVEMSPQGKMISFGKTFEWWEIALYGIGLVALGFAAGAGVSK